MKDLILTTVCLILLSSIAISQTAGETQVAVSSVSASSNMEGTTPQMAADGDDKTFWYSGAMPPGHITLDLGKEIDVSRIELKVAQNPAGRTTHNVFAWVSNSWSLVSKIEQETSNLQLLNVKVNLKTRYISVHTILSPSWVGWYEIKVFQSTTQSIYPLLINFQPQGVPTPQGYLADTGKVFGQNANGIKMGWNVDMSERAFDRQSIYAPDQRYDTFITMFDKDRVHDKFWEIELPNGTYVVRLVAGDPGYGKNALKINIENQVGINRETDTFSNWAECKKIIEVKDGRLTVTSAAGALLNSINFIEIDQYNGGNVTPSLSLTSPTSGSVYLKSATVHLRASAFDPENSINRVIFFNGSILLGEDLEAPYTYQVTGLTEGRHDLYAKVIDGAGNEVTALTQVTVKGSSLNDDFNNNLLDSEKWTVSDSISADTVPYWKNYLQQTVMFSEENQALKFTLAPRTQGYKSVVSSHFDVSGRSVQVEVPQVTDQGGWTETFFLLESDDNNFFEMRVRAGYFHMVSNTNGVRDIPHDGTLPRYNSKTDRYWRISHIPESNEIEFQTSTDGINWTSRRTSKITFPINSLRVRLMAGANGTGNTVGGVAIFDNLQLSGARPTVRIIEPAENSTHAKAVSSIKVEANDPDGLIKDLILTVDGAEYKRASSDSLIVTNLQLTKGRHVLSATAIDNEGMKSTSRAVTINISDFEDKDSDSLPDDWEMKYFGNLSSSSLDDPDRDGVNNLNEYLQGRNPAKPVAANSRNIIRLKVYTTLD
jgi:hypothetical protein